MSGYWDNTPKGVWRIEDYQDALDVLADEESRASYDKKSHRIMVYGPPGKAIIIELSSIESLLLSGDILEFHRLIYSLTGLNL